MIVTKRYPKSAALPQELREGKQNQPRRLLLSEFLPALCLTGQQVLADMPWLS